MTMLKHKGYFGNIDTSIEDNVLHGKLQFISALVTYEGETLAELNEAFIDSVEDYLETCKAKGYEPEQPCKGSFNVRLGHDLHLAAAVKAKESGITLNELVRSAIDKTVSA